MKRFRVVVELEIEDLMLEPDAEQAEFIAGEVRALLVGVDDHAAHPSFLEEEVRAVHAEVVP